MDDAAYARARAVANPAPCVFEKALLAGCATCELAQRHALAEREGVACPSPTARINCATLLALLRERATFTLRLPGPGEPLRHARAMQLQCGGLQGLCNALAAPEADVHRMVMQAHARIDSLLDLPWGGIARDIAAWQARRRR
jgi:hypothetical protein